MAKKRTPTHTIIWRILLVVVLVSFLGSPLYLMVVYLLQALQSGAL